MKSPHLPTRRSIRLCTALVATLLLLPLFSTAAHAQHNFDDVQIKTIPLGNGLSMLMGAGGNIGLSVGGDGAFVIDDQYAPLTERILAAVAEQTGQPVRFVVNTHWHGDHTGGNEHMDKAGAIIVAHENVRKRMSTEQFLAAFDNHVPASPEAALPVITFTDAVTFHWNGDEVRIFHVAPAHTDGDAVIHFTKSNVIHTGDTFFNKMYPFIDASTGGRIDGMIDAVDRILPLVDDETQIIPGHGPLANKADLETYRAMLATASARMHKLIDAGKTREEAIEAKPTADLDADWGDGFLKPDVWVGIVYDSIVGQ